MKKGEITSSQLVKIILLVVGFTIVLWIFPTLLNEREVDREICHDSVLLRGALPDNLNIKNLPSLKCQTRKVCLTDKIFGKGDCAEEFGEDKYETIKISADNREEEINRFVARELADCWAMMGLGKLQIFTRKSTDEKRCVVCSRISFDKELKEELNKKVDGLGDYVLTHEVPNQNVSYWEYLTKKRTIENYDKNFDSFTTSGKAITFMEIGEDAFLKMTSTWVLTAVGGVLGFKVGSPGAGLYAGYFTGSLLGSALDKEIKYRTGWIFLDYNSEELKSLECDSFENIP